MASDILFALSDTGGGHRSVALALSAGIEELADRRVACNIDDLLYQTKFPFLKKAATYYNHLTTDYVAAYNAGFRLTDSQIRMTILAQIVYRASRRHIITTLDRFRPKLIVVTHPFLVGHLVCAARRDWKFDYRVVTVVTDPVSIHAAWCCAEVDAYIVFSDDVRAKLEHFGIPADRISITSFPVHPDFDPEYRGKTDARRALGISENSYTVLITGGGAGSGIAPELVQLLENHDRIQLLVVTGDNVKLYRRLTQTSRARTTRIFGRVHNMATLMAACDIVVTKAGPSTLMEAASMNRPVVITGAVGLQEVANIGMALKHGIGVSCNGTAETNEIVRGYCEQQFGGKAVHSLRIGRSEPANILLGEYQKALHGALRQETEAGSSTKCGTEGLQRVEAKV